MAELDKRFALIRDGKPWYAALIAGQGGAQATYRISKRGQTRDAHNQAEQLTDIATVALRVLKEGKRMRCAPEGAPANSLDTESRGVTGYRLDPAIARALGIPESGDFV